MPSMRVTENMCSILQAMSLTETTDTNLHQTLPFCRIHSPGIGKPEPLKYLLAGCWSRRVTQDHRLVYRVVDDRLICRRDLTSDASLA
jgi:Txe/YoeB family toxin of toxin-antitoxin system